MVNPMIKSNLGRKFASSHSLKCIMEGDQGRNSNRNLEAKLMKRPLGNDAYWLALSVFFFQLSVLYNPGSCDHVRDATTQNGWALQYQSLIRQMHRRLTYRPIWWRQFLSWGLSFPDVSIFCQVDKILTSTFDPLLSWHINKSLPNHNHFFWLMPKISC